MEDNDFFEESLEPTNEIVEITDEDKEQTVYDMEAPVEEKPTKGSKNKAPKRSLKDKWRDLSKKQKTIIICVSVALILIIVGVLLYFLVFKKDKAEVKHEPEVIVEKENYRYEDGKLIFLDVRKNELGTYECQNQDEDKCYVAYYSAEDDFDIAKRVNESNQGIEELSDIFAKRYVFIYDNRTNKNGNIILYDMDENKEYGTYKLVKKIDDENVIVKNEEDMYGILNLAKDAEETVDYTYDYLGHLPEAEDIVAKTGNSSKIISLTGEDVSNKVTGDIKNYDEDHISVSNGGKYSVYDYNGQVVLANDADFVTFKSGYIFTVTGKRLYAYDSDINLLNYEAVKLATTNYVTKITFDDKLKEVKREEAFSIGVGGNTITISEEGEAIKEINALEGKLSGEYQNISYYDGILYIFKDKEKSSLLGKYACTTKNTITKNTTTLENCTIAQESSLLNRAGNEKLDAKVGILPIYNNRYAFIKDVDNNKNNIIVLRDLKESDDKKVKATYQAVDAGYYKNDDNLSFVDTESTLVMAQNTSGNYGIIKISKDNVNGVISFDKKQNNEGSIPKDVLGKTIAIKLLNNMFVVTNENKNYVIYNITGGNYLTYASNEIVEYNSKNNAVKVKNGSLYDIVRDGKNIVTALNYARMEDNYIIGVSGKNVDVYEYKESAKGLFATAHEKDDTLELPEMSGVDYSKIRYDATNNVLETDKKSYSLAKTKDPNIGPVEEETE